MRDQVDEERWSEDWVGVEGYEWGLMNRGEGI